MNERHHHQLSEDLREAMMYLESMYEDCPVSDQDLMIAAHILIQKAYFDYLEGGLVTLDESNAVRLAKTRADYAIAIADHDSRYAKPK